ncbi:unnamed protein product, partial [Meganyctiphanes norvegica]
CGGPGECNRTIVIDKVGDPNSTTWFTPGWNGADGSYSDNCCCILTIQFKVQGFVTMTFADHSFVHDSTNCQFDKLEIDFDDGLDHPDSHQHKIHCDSLSSLEEGFEHFENTIHTSTVTFCPVVEPGGSLVDTGFLMNIT